MRRLPMALKLVAAAVIPGSCAIAILSAVQRYSRTPDTPVLPRDRFAEYVADVPRSGQTLPAGTVIWSGSAGADARSFRDMAAIRRALVLVSAERLVVLDQSGAERSNTPVSELEADASAVSAAPDGNAFWVYSTLTGHAVQHVLSSPGARTGRAVTLDKFAGTPYWLGGGIIKNGTYAYELLRVYRPPAAPSSPMAQAEVVHTVDTPLFQGLPRTFSRQLHDSTLAPRPDGAKLALVFHWHDRVNIYDVASQSLERAVSGPHLSKLEFSLVDGGSGGTARIRPNDDSMTAYIDVATTTETVVALFAGRDERRFPGASTLADTLHVFTWDGRLRGIWRLTESVSNIAIDEPSRSLFALRRSPAAAVIRVDVTSVLASP